MEKENIVNCISNNQTDSETFSGDSIESGFYKGSSYKFLEHSEFKRGDKRTRVVLRDKQKKRLMSVFKSEILPSSDLKEHLAKELNLPIKTIQIWFQNQRQRYRKEASRGIHAPLESVYYGSIKNGGKSKLDYLADAVDFLWEKSSKEQNQKK